MINAIDFRLFIGCPCDVTGVGQVTIDGIDRVYNKVTCQGEDYIPGIVKPILRKFENLSRHELEGLNKLWPMENIKRTTFDSIKLDANIIDYLTALNVDVFGWIDQGLAIDAQHNSTH